MFADIIFHNDCFCFRLAHPCSMNFLFFFVENFIIKENYFYLNKKRTKNVFKTYKFRNVNKFFAIY